eukprot:CFRG6352T1
MRYVAAYLLASLGSSSAPGAADVEKILSSVGIDADQEKLNSVISELEGKNLDEVLAAGQEKLASVPSGGAAAPAADAASGDAPAVEAAKAPEPEEESEEEDMGFGLFD